VATTNGIFEIVYRDYNGQDSSVKLRTQTISAANFDAHAVLVTNLLNALADVLIGVPQTYDVGNEVVNSVAPPDDPTAQRELAWKIFFHNGTTFLSPQTSQIPCPALTLLDPNDRKNAEIGDADDVDNFVSKFQAYVISPGGNAPVIDEIELKGRNL